jgi:hypothetical protein
VTAPQRAQPPRRAPNVHGWSQHWLFSPRFAQHNVCFGRF